MKGDGGEGEGEGGGKRAEKGRGRGRGKVARRLEREMRANRLQSAKMMKRVHRKEARQGHWACEGMGGGEGKGKGGR